MGLIDSIELSASGMMAQSQRMKIVAQNIANKDSTALDSNSEPYRRKIIFLQAVKDRVVGAETVKVYKVSRDYKSEFQRKYNPAHPAADSDGYVKYPNVNGVIELADAREAKLEYDANLGAFSVARDMLARAIDLLR